MSSFDSDHDLFSSAPPPGAESGLSGEPLAARMRPRTIDEFIGQDHILGPGRLLRRAIAADMLGSIILSGPPGTGKTTLARVIANTTRSAFLSLNAVLGGVKDVRAAIEKAQEHHNLYGRRTILFVDEVHRWNKAQQDALLPWVENGTVVLIGATTENPFFEVNSALVSRSRIFQLTPLTEDDLSKVAQQALSDRERGYGGLNVQVDDDALDHLVRVADGDARTLLNALQLAVETTPDRFPPSADEPIHITVPIAEESIQRGALLYDREGDYHYDTISAFIKSVRGSDPDAALYWMARMIRAGEDPHYLFRRMLVLACEDVGLADPHALGVVESAAAAFDRVGMPEGQYHLTHAALYLATAPKSNSALGYFDAVKAVEEERSREVPKHLRDDSRDSAGFGHGEGYKYPHSYRDHWVAQAYLPGDLAGRIFYRPSSQGYEARIAVNVERRREVQLAEVDDTADDGEILTFTPPGVGVDDGWDGRAHGRESDDNGSAESGDRRSGTGDEMSNTAQTAKRSTVRRRWAARTAASSKLREAVRDSLFAAADPPRHARVLVYEAGPPVLLWEALRRVPEGTVVALFARDEDRDRAADRLGGGSPRNRNQPPTDRADEAPSVQSTNSDDTGGWSESGDSAVVDASASSYVVAPQEPILLTGRPSQLLADEESGLLRELVSAGFEAIVCDRLFSRVAGEGDEPETEATALFYLAAPATPVVIAEPAPMAGQRLSEVAPSVNVPADTIELLTEAEHHLFHRSPESDRNRWRALLESVGFSLTECSTREVSDRRRLDRETVAGWIDVDGAYTKALDGRYNETRLVSLRDMILSRLAGRQVSWRRAFDLVSVRRKD